MSNQTQAPDSMQGMAAMMQFMQLVQARDNAAIIMQETASTQVGKLALQSCALNALIQNARKGFKWPAIDWMQGQPNSFGSMMPLLMQMNGGALPAAPAAPVAPAAVTKADFDQLVGTVNALAAAVAKLSEAK